VGAPIFEPNNLLIARKISSGPKFQWIVVWWRTY
jgi:hypothetical protein